MKSQVSADTQVMFGIHKDCLVHNEETLGRQANDKVKDNLLSVLQRFFNIFGSDLQYILQNIATKDLASDIIHESLLNAADLCQEQSDISSST